MGIKREATPNSSEEDRLYHFHELNCLKYFNIYNSVPDAKRNWCRSHQGGFVTKKWLLKKGKIGLFNIWIWNKNGACRKYARYRISVRSNQRY